MTKSVFIEVFSNKDDADYWIENHLKEHEGWSIIEAEVKFIRDGAWRAGIILTDQPEQLEFNI